MLLYYRTALNLNTYSAPVGALAVDSAPSRLYRLAMCGFGDFLLILPRRFLGPAQSRSLRGESFPLISPFGLRVRAPAGPPQELHSVRLGVFQ